MQSTRSFHTPDRYKLCTFGRDSKHLFCYTRCTLNDSAHSPAADLVETLSAQGVILWREGDNIRYRAPSGVLTPGLLACIKARKNELLKHLDPYPLPTRQARSGQPNVLLLRGGSARHSLFCVHAVDGGIGSYLEFAEHLSPHVKTYGIIAMDLIHRTHPPRCIKQLAKRYVDQVQEVQPRGPYALVGWSAGSWIAFEMACELSNRGAQVASLTVLDAGAPPRTAVLDRPSSSNGIALSPSQEDSARLWWRFLALYTADVADDPFPPQFWLMDDSQKSRFVLDHARDRAIFPRDHVPSAGKSTADILYMFNTVNIQYDAIMGYEPSRTDSRLNLFLACPATADEIAVAQHLRNAEAFWKSRTSGALHLELIPGDHTAPLSQPGLQAVARRIRHCSVLTTCRSHMDSGSAANSSWFESSAITSARPGASPDLSFSWVNTTRGPASSSMYANRFGG